MISLKKFIDENNGKYVSFKDSDKHPKECVTLVQEYLRQCYGIPFKARGNAKSWINTTKDIATIVTKPQYGDIIVWDGTYGHVAIYIDGKRYFDQYNGKVSGYSTNSVSANRKILGYLRLKGTRKPDEVDTPIKSDFNLSRTLKNGSRGNDVRELQKALGGIAIDGIFGKATERKVKAFQKAKKLTQDGIVGRATATSLGWSYGKYNLTRLLKNGSKGNDVKELQKALGGLKVDGIFGKATLAKLKAFQRAKGLTADGIVGLRTARALGWTFKGK